jgi:hypothetical protein
MVLGATTPDASQLPPVDGVAVIRGAGDGAALRGTTTLRLHYTSATDAAEMMKRAIAAREALGTMPGGQDGDVPPVVEQVAKVIRMSGEPWMFSTEVAEAVGVQPKPLAEQMRRARVEARPVRTERNRMAYFREDVEQALSRGRRSLSERLSGGSPQGLRVVAAGRAGE